MKTIMVDFKEVRAFASDSKYYLKHKYKYEKGTLLLAHDHTTRVGLIAWVVSGSQSGGRVYSQIAPTVTSNGIKILEEIK